jgi:F-type H+-transporting ATPase subunit alpha
VSRVGGNAQTKAMKRVAGRLKIELSQYRDLEAFAQFGSDLDPDTQRTLARGARLVQTLNQNEREPLPVSIQVVQVFAATNGFLDRIEIDRVPEFLDGLTQRARSEGTELLDKIEAGDWSDETQAELKTLIRDFADDFGYDFDEEGQPIAEGDSDRVTARPAAAAAEDVGEESEAQAEAAGAAA